MLDNQITRTIIGCAIKVHKELTTEKAENAQSAAEEMPPWPSEFSSEFSAVKNNCK